MMEKKDSGHFQKENISAFFFKWVLRKAKWITVCLGAASGNMSRCYKFRDE